MKKKVENRILKRRTEVGVLEKSQYCTTLYL